VIAEVQGLTHTASASQKALQENDKAFGDFFDKLLKRLEEVQKQVSEFDALVQDSLSEVRCDIAGAVTSLEENMRAAVDAIVRLHDVSTRNVLESVVSEHNSTRRGLETAMAREHADTRRYIAVAAADQHVRAVQASNLQYDTIRAMTMLFEKEHTMTTMKTIEMVQRENDETRTQVAASVSGLALNITNDMREDRAHLLRVEARLQDLIKRVEPMVDPATITLHIRLPGFRRLRVGRQLAMKCCELLADTPVTLSSRDVIIGAAILAATAQTGHLMLAYAAISISLSIWRLVRGVMYQVPTVHMIFIIDFFDSRIGIPLEEATSSEARFYRAHFGRLLLMRKIADDASGTCSTRQYDGACSHPGDAL